MQRIEILLIILTNRKSPSADCPTLLSTSKVKFCCIWAIAPPFRTRLGAASRNHPLFPPPSLVNPLAAILHYGNLIIDQEVVLAEQL
nr:hypothetical protein [Arthrospira sp. PLM2.Bin9]